MIKMNYEYNNVSGTPTLVFLHGWGLSGSSFDGIIGRLQCNCSTLKIDLLGFGDSDKAYDYFDTYEYAYTVYLLLKQLDVNRVILVGHSFGGRLCILLSSVFDIDVKGLVLASSAGINKFSLIKYLKIKKYKVLKWLVSKGLLFNKNLSGYGSRDFRNLDKEMRCVFIRVVNQDLKKFARKIECKNTYLVWDKNDKETEYWICKKLHKNICNSRVVLYKSGGHFVAFKNANKFSKLIDDLCVDINNIL